MRAATGRARYRGEAGPWRAFARIDHPDPGAANEQALDDLANGADGLQVVFAGAGGAYGFGLARHDSATLHRAFEGVRFDRDALRTRSRRRGGGAGDRLRRAGRACRRQRLPRSTVAFGLDPIGALARSGRAARAFEEEGRALAKLALFLKAKGFAGPFVAADARWATRRAERRRRSSASRWRRRSPICARSPQNGFTREAAAAAIGFRLAADADQFVTLAKFRALRLLWARALRGLRPRAAPARHPCRDRLAGR